MSSAEKTLKLLSHFTTMRPEIGLSELCRIAKRDKATTYRHLQSLEAVGFVEQNPQSKQYRLGPALLQLGQIREATVPRKDSAMPILARLAQETGETAHASVLSGELLYSLAFSESAMHGTRAIIDVTTLPLHATASGLSALAFGPEDLFEVALAGMERFTEATPMTRAALSELVEAARATGIAKGYRSFEAEIQGMSAPIFEAGGRFAGAVSVASVAARFTPDLERRVADELVQASRDITQSWGGRISPHLETVWAQSLARPYEMDPIP